MSELTDRQIEAIGELRDRMNGWSPSDFSAPSDMAELLRNEVANLCDALLDEQKPAAPQPKDGDIAKVWWRDGRSRDGGERLAMWVGSGWGDTVEAGPWGSQPTDYERIVTAEDALAELQAYYEERKGTETLTHGWRRAVEIVERLIAEAKHG